MRAVAEDIGVDAVKIGMLGDGRDDRGGRRALDLVADAPVVLDPVMVAESGARLLDEDARGGAARAARAARDRRHAEPRRRRASLARRRRGRGAPEELARADPRARAAGASWSPAATASEAIDVFFDGEQLVEIPGERHPDGAAHGSGCTHSSALAAHLALGLDPLEAARAAKEIASEAVATACATSARARARGRLRHARRGERPDRLATGGAATRGIIASGASMKFLRMKPGHGEVLLAEGDPRVREDEERLVEEFRRQLDEGMWAAVPVDRTGQRPARGADGAGLRARSRRTPSA